MISLGAAPPDTLDLVLGALAPGGLLALSYNDATLADAEYVAKLDQVQAKGVASLTWFEHGAHLPAKGLGSTVYILRRA